MQMIKGKVLALGLFDAIHIGHRYLIEKAQRYALQNKLEFLLLTFDDDFYNYIDKKEKSIYTLAERQLLMQKLDIPYYVIPSSHKFFNFNAQDFYTFLTQFNPEAIFVGKDYSFGANGRWHSIDMQKYYSDKDVTVVIIDLLTQESEKVSSSLIKTLLAKGNINYANLLLGDDFYIIGKVVPGKRIGRTMGIPTANLQIAKNKCIPKWGVYATVVKIDGKLYKGLANVGNQPTFDSGNPCVEVHLLDFNNNIYNKEIKLIFKEYLRDIISFSSPEELKAQIKCDIKRTLELW